MSSGSTPARRAGRPKRSHPPTAQQQAIIDAAVTQKLDVAVQALAGTGKTSTLNMVAQRVAEASPQTRIVYIAFNASIAREARETFGPNVTSVTAHALALRSLRTGPHAGKTTRIGKGVRHPGDIADLLNLEAVAYRDHDGDPQELAPSVRAQLAMAVVRTFRESADPQITQAHLPDALTAFPGTGRAVLDTARQIWDDIADPSNARLLEGDRPRAVLFDHDDHLKLWALSRPRIDADLIFFDEAQDINAVLRRLVQDQPTQTIVVGDTFQSIYGFRGTEDALAHWPAEVTLPLTRSWRFGPEIARRGDDFLRLLGAPYELTGNPALASTVGQVTAPDAVLCRTNVGAVSEVFRAFDAGKRVALVGGGGEISKLARAAKDLKAGRGTRHPELSRFATWADVEEAARQERALQPFVRLIDQHGPDELLRMVGKSPPASPRLRPWTTGRPPRPPSRSRRLPLPSLKRPWTRCLSPLMLPCRQRTACPPSPLRLRRPQQRNPPANRQAAGPLPLGRPSPPREPPRPAAPARGIAVRLRSRTARSTCSPKSNPPSPAPWTRRRQNRPPRHPRTSRTTSMRRSHRDHPRPPTRHPPLQQVPRQKTRTTHRRRSPAWTTRSQHWPKLITNPPPNPRPPTRPHRRRRRKTTHRASPSMGGSARHRHPAPRPSPSRMRPRETTRQRCRSATSTPGSRRSDAPCKTRTWASTFPRRSRPRTAPATVREPMPNRATANVPDPPRRPQGSMTPLPRRCRRRPRISASTPGPRNGSGSPRSSQPPTNWAAPSWARPAATGARPRTTCGSGDSGGR
ncbi:AAA family ATPase [Actinomadura formosensis]|uniref:AAA family ATPase n=1 Tax=Actinomadura formosensis TaxID=60706 RepID=UPI003D8CD954